MFHTANSPVDGRMSDLKKIPETVKKKNKKLETLDEWIQKRKMSLEREEQEEREMKQKKYTFPSHNTQ